MRLHLADDFDGTPIAEGDGGTIRFALNGATYEIDLTNAHIQEFETLLEPYIKHGRKLRMGGMTSWRDVDGAVTSGRTDLAAIREWARNNGHKVSDKGRIASTVIAAYDARKQTQAEG